MFIDNLILTPHKPLVSNKELNDIVNISNKVKYKDKYLSNEDAMVGLSKVAKAYSKLRRLTREEFDSIALHELIFTNKSDEKMFLAQIMLQNSKFVTIPNKLHYRRPIIITRTKNIIDQKGNSGIDFGKECTKYVSDDNTAQVKFWYKGYVLFFNLDPRDGFDWQHNKTTYQHDWLDNMKNFFDEFAHGYRHKHNKHSEHNLNYSSFRSHVGMSVVESIPDMSIIEDDDEIFKECERLYTKYTKRQAMRINIDVFTRKLTTSENLEKLMDTLPSDFSSEFYSLSRYHKTISQRNDSWNNGEKSDYDAYKKSKDKRKKVNKLFKIYILPDLKRFIAKYGGDTYESSISKLVEDNIGLFKNDNVDDIMEGIFEKTEPIVSIYNTIVALK